MDRNHPGGDASRSLPVPAAAMVCGTYRLTYPKMRSGWDKKSVILSSMLLGSSTKVGKVILERSIPGRCVCVGTGHR